VPDMLKLAGARVEYGDVSLVGWGVTNVATGDRDHRATKERERRGNLLASRQPGKGRAPERVTVGNGELLDVAIGRRGVNGLPVRIGGRCGCRDLARSGPVGVALRSELPEDRSAVGVHRERLAVGRGHEEHVVR